MVISFILNNTFVKFLEIIVDIFILGSGYKNKNMIYQQYSESIFFNCAL